jgi:hypothetical protein
VSTETTLIEKDLERTRAHLDATIGSLQERLSPGQLLDQALDYFKASGGAEFGRNLKRQVQDHPMPVALVGIGLAWLMMSGNGRPEARDIDYRPTAGAWGDEIEDSERRGLIAKAEEAAAAVRRTASESYEAFQDRVYSAKAAALGIVRDMGEAMSSFASRVDRAMQRTSEMGRRTGQMGRSAAGSMADSARGVRDTIGQAAENVRYGVGEAARGVSHGVGNTARGLREAGGRTLGLFQEQPLLLGALCVTVGALLAALLPPTRTEDEMLGEIRDDLRDRAQEAGSEALRSGARVASEVSQAASEAAEREGLTPAGARSAAETAHSGMADVARRARHVVEQTASAGRTAAERELERGGEEHDTTAPTGSQPPSIHGVTSIEADPIADGPPIGTTPTAFKHGGRASG